MPQNYLTISFSKPSSSTTCNKVVLEQEPWPKSVGRLTKAGALYYLNSLLFGDPEEDLVENCGGTSSECSSIVYAYPDSPLLNYIIGISNGELGDKVVEELEYSELIQIQPGQGSSFKYPVLRMVSATWLADVYLPSGEKLPKPPIVVGPDGITVTDGIYGTILATYVVHRHKYITKAIAKAGATENKFQTFIYAVWEGGNTVIAFKPSVDAESGSCGTRGGSNVSITPPSDSGPPKVYPEDKHVEWDYCANCALEYKGLEIKNGRLTRVYECQDEQ